MNDKAPGYVNWNADLGMRVELFEEERGTRMILRDTDACEVVGNKVFVNKKIDDVKDYANLCLCFDY